MKLPAKETNLGRVLRAMHGAGPMTSGGIRKKANLAPDTAVTARVRDLRKMGIGVTSFSTPHPISENKRLWYYKVTYLPKTIREALADEQSRERVGAAA